MPVSHKRHEILSLANGGLCYILIATAELAKWIDMEMKGQLTICFLETERIPDHITLDGAGLILQFPLTLDPTPDSNRVEIEGGTI